MALEIVPYSGEAVGAVREFNQRLLAGGAGAEHEQFPETPHPGWLPGLELFLAIEEGQVRGGYMLRRQQFRAGGVTCTAAHYRLPLSEGVIDRRYAMLGLRLVRDALARESRLYAMGMAGWEKPLPQMLKRLGWTMEAVPFHFKVVHPGRFLRQIRHLRSSPLRRAALDVAAFSGGGWLALKALGMTRRAAAGAYELASGFAPWADEVWERSRPAYALLAQRDAATLDQLYPPSDARFLRVRAAGGWAVLLDTQMENHKQFGDMRVGTIVDCLAPPESAAAIIRAAASVLEARGVDLIVSNQMHAAWRRGLVDSGFRVGPSNYLLSLSPAFSEAAGVCPADPPTSSAETGRLKPAPPGGVCPADPPTSSAETGRLKPAPPGGVCPADPPTSSAETGRLKPAPPGGVCPAGRLKPAPPGARFDQFHVNRGDGDGPVHL